MRNYYPQLKFAKAINANVDRVVVVVLPRFTALQRNDRRTFRRSIQCIPPSSGAPQQAADPDGSGAPFSRLLSLMLWENLLEVNASDPRTDEVVGRAGGRLVGSVNHSLPNCVYHIT